MRVEDFPRPPADNRRGVHWSASVYHPTGKALDPWMRELGALKIKWVKLIDDGGGSSLETCERLLAAGMMPVVGIFRSARNPGAMGGREEDTVRRLVTAGVRYFETNNEPDLALEWPDRPMPSHWLQVVVDNFIHDAETILGLGGLPAFPAMGTGARLNPAALLAERGRADLFECGAWLAVHNYTLNHPLDYPFDRINQAGARLTPLDYELLGSRAWDGNTLEEINRWRMEDKSPGAALETDPSCFLAFRLLDAMTVKTLGYRVPMISTEGGPLCGTRDDRRYPRVTPQIHAEMVAGILEFMQGRRELAGDVCPPNYFACCHWLLANYRLGCFDPTWESQAWYTDWWNTVFGLRGQLPVVEAVKAMPNIAIDGLGARIEGRVLRSDTGEPEPGVEVQLFEGDCRVAAAVSGEDGSYRIPVVPPGRYNLVAPGVGVVQSNLIVRDASPQNIVIRLPGSGKSTLAGIVRDYSGAPQPHVEVRLTRAGETIAEGLTGAEGCFSFGRLPLGVYSVQAPNITVAGIALDGWSGKNVKLTMAPAFGYRYGVDRRRLAPPAEAPGAGMFYGVVRNALGQPLNGVKVQMSWSGATAGAEFPVAVTGQDGSRPAGFYSFVHTPGVFALQVVQGDWPGEIAGDLQTAVSEQDRLPPSYEVDFRLQTVEAPAYIQGQVPGGRPGQAVSLMTLDATDRPLGRVDATLAADYSFAFARIAAGRYAISLQGIGTVGGPLDVAAGGLFMLILPLRSRIEGQVIGAAPGSRAILYAPAPWEWTRQAPIGPLGTFNLGDLPPGRYRLQLADRTLADLLLTGENTLRLPVIDLGAGRRSAVTGRVLDRAGEPHAGAGLTLMQGENSLGATTSTAGGSYRFGNLLAATYSLEVEGMGVVAPAIELDGEQEVVYDIVWTGSARTGVLRGRMLNDKGAPLAGTAVLLMQDGSEVARTSTSADGAFAFDELAAGVYALALADGAVLASGVLVDDDRTVTVDLAQSSAHKPLGEYVLLSGRASTPDGKPAAGAAERLALQLALPFLIKTGASGGFDPESARLADRVIIAGDRIPGDVDGLLQTAQCEVKRLPGDGAALAQAFQRLTWEMGDG